MLDREKPIHKLIEEFRKSKFYQHVVRVRFSTVRAKHALADLLDLEGEVFKAEFRRRFERFFMLGPYKEFVNVIVRENSVEDLKNIIRVVFKDEVAPVAKYNLVLKLKGINAFFASQFLTFAYNGDYMPWYDSVIEGIKNMVPWIVERIGGIQDYWDYDALCKVIKDSYGFKDLAEVFEFFGHGQEEEWKFK